MVRCSGSIAALKTGVSVYEGAHFARASWQLTSTLGAYVAALALMYATLFVWPWVTAILSILTGGLIVRIFIIFHDCVHGSFFRSRRANRFWGFVTGLVTFTPYEHWRWFHSRHHATSGNLEHRGAGDVRTMTVEEYLQASWHKRLLYRATRNPVVLFVVSPIILFTYASGQ